MNSDQARVVKELKEAVLAYVKVIHPSRRDLLFVPGAECPTPPYPDPANPMLRLLLTQARMHLDTGEQLEHVLLHLAVSAWAEGHIEGYDEAGQ